MKRQSQTNTNPTIQSPFGSAVQPMPQQLYSNSSSILGSPFGSSVGSGMSMMRNRPQTLEEQTARRAKQEERGAQNRTRTTPFASMTPAEQEAERAKRQEHNERHRIENEKNIAEFGVKTLSQEEILQTIAQRQFDFQILRSAKIKALLVCVSYDEDRIRQNCIDIIRYLNSDFGVEIEFFCVNPEFYGPPRRGHQIWIDREHYFQMPFGEQVNPDQYPDINRLIQTGPYDFIIYSHCSIYNRRNPSGVSPNLNAEGQQLNAIMKPDTALVIYPFSTIPVGVTIGFRSIGLDLIGKTAEKTPRIHEIGIYMKHQ